MKEVLECNMNFNLLLEFDKNFVVDKEDYDLYKNGELSKEELLFNYLSKDNYLRNKFWFKNFNNSGIDGVNKVEFFKRDILDGRKIILE